MTGRPTMRGLMNLTAGAGALLEGRDAPLYHHMRAEKALAVFAADAMPGRWEHDVPGLGRLRGNSFTRNPRLAYPADVIITVDQARLARRYRIVPLDAEYVHGHTDPGYRANSEGLRDRKDNRQGRWQQYLLSEEFVVGDIADLHRYIAAIRVNAGMVDDDEVAHLLAAARAYSAAHGIPVEVADHLLRGFPE